MDYSVTLSAYRDDFGDWLPLMGGVLLSVGAALCPPQVIWHQLDRLQDISKKTNLVEVRGPKETVYKNSVKPPEIELHMISEDTSGLATW